MTQKAVFVKLKKSPTVNHDHRTLIRVDHITSISEQAFTESHGLRHEWLDVVTIEGTTHRTYEKLDDFIMRIKQYWA